VNFYVMGVGIYDENAHRYISRRTASRVSPSRFHNLRRKKPSRSGCTSISSR
jgi:hypothetical protein